MDLATARTLLPEIRQLQQLASPQWCEFYNVEKGLTEVCARESKAAPVEPIAVILPACGFDDRRLMLKAPELISAACVLLDEAFRIIRASQPKPARDDRKKTTPAQRLAILYGEPAFLKYLEEHHGLERPLTKERADTKVKFLLRITSKNELNEPGTSQDAWKRLIAAYHQWRKS